MNTLKLTLALLIIEYFILSASHPSTMYSVLITHWFSIPTLIILVLSTVLIVFFFNILNKDQSFIKHQPLNRYVLFSFVILTFLISISKLSTTLVKACGFVTGLGADECSRYVEVSPTWPQYALLLALSSLTALLAYCVGNFIHAKRSVKREAVK
jgi:hypothetical protein